MWSVDPGCRSREKNSYQSDISSHVNTLTFCLRFWCFLNSIWYSIDKSVSGLQSYGHLHYINSTNNSSSHIQFETVIRLSTTMRKFKVKYKYSALFICTFLPIPPFPSCPFFVIRHLPSTPFHPHPKGSGKFLCKNRTENSFGFSDWNSSKTEARENPSMSGRCITIKLFIKICTSLYLIHGSIIFKPMVEWSSQMLPCPRNNCSMANIEISWLTLKLDSAELL